MRWIHTASPVDENVLQIEYSAACALGKIRPGENHLFFSKFSGVSYLPYTQIRRAWIRIEQVSARLCCGRANFDQIFLMVEDSDGLVRRTDLKTKELAKQVLAVIESKNPATEIGYHKPATA